MLLNNIENRYKEKVVKLEVDKVKDEDLLLFDLKEELEFNIDYKYKEKDDGTIS